MKTLVVSNADSKLKYKEPTSLTLLTFITYFDLKYRYGHLNKYEQFMLKLLINSTEHVSSRRTRTREEPI